MNLEININNRPVTIPEILGIAIELIRQSGYHDAEYIIKSLQSHEESRLSNNRSFNDINVMRWKENEALKTELEAVHKALSLLSARKQKQIDDLESSLDQALECCNEDEDND